ncbi:MAG: hypothetical protein ACI84D_003883 [Thalassolituus oleivorans]|jgi:hypothetical protein
MPSESAVIETVHLNGCAWARPAATTASTRKRVRFSKTPLVFWDGLFSTCGLFKYRRRGKELEAAALTRLETIRPCQHQIKTGHAFWHPPHPTSGRMLSPDERPQPPPWKRLAGFGVSNRGTRSVAILAAGQGGGEANALADRAFDPNRPTTAVRANRTPV